MTNELGTTNIVLKSATEQTNTIKLEKIEIGKK